ncbi:MAG: dynamin family protein [Paracoccaceae bacterium]
MNELTQDFKQGAPDAPANSHLLAMGSEVLAPLVSAFDETLSAIDRLTQVASPQMAKRAAALGRKLENFEPSVTLVGQVKAGKTALTNVMAGSVDLLPSDVNPWTSVVTTLHLSPQERIGRTKAQFTFFDTNEWAGLVSNGGRLGEMAERAGANDEMEMIQEQIAKMREQAQSRLGSSFEALLGQVHKYGYYDRELVERYVCMGDEDAAVEDPSNKQGRFADITRSAELFVHQPHLKSKLTIRDTPGVNDTFMVREQITIKALRGSEICLVVLSAHQALNTTDMALIRMISNFERRQVVLFINRIDELAKPSEQIPEIHKSIISSLKASNAPVDCEIIFGSAKWAEAALSGRLDILDAESQAALLDWAESVKETGNSDSFTHTWILSGFPKLMHAVNTRILEGSGKRLLDSIRIQVNNLTNEILAEKHVGVADMNTAGPVDRTDLAAALETLLADHEKKLRDATDTLISDLRPRLEKVQSSFVRRATDALIVHLERYGEQDNWQYDSTGLRLLLRSAYAQFGVSTRRRITAVYNEAAVDIESVYHNALGVNVEGFHIVPPSAPPIPPPIVLSKTIALDLSGSWWRRWWQKRRGFEAFASDYSTLIHAEVASIIQELEQTQIAEIFDSIELALQEFLSDQRDTLLRLSETSQTPTEAHNSEPKRDEVAAALGDALSALDLAAA